MAISSTLDQFQQVNDTGLRTTAQKSRLLGYDKAYETQQRKKSDNTVKGTELMTVELFQCLQSQRLCKQENIF